MTAPAQTAAPAGLTQKQRDVLARMVRDALEQRTPPGDCGDCELHPAGLCEPCAEDLDVCEDYLALARELGIEVPD